MCLDCLFQNYSSDAFNGEPSSQGSGVITVASLNTLINQSQFINNTNSLGGAINFYYNLVPEAGGGNLMILESKFIGNKALYGGAVYLDPAVLNFQLYVQDSMFDSNNATESHPSANDGGFGGAFYISLSGNYNSSCFFQRNTFITNSANTLQHSFGITITGAGGGIYFQSNNNIGSCVLTDNEFTGNTANFGGGMLFIGGATMASTDNTFNSNNAIVNGGAAFIQNMNFLDANNTYLGKLIITSILANILILDVKCR